MACIIESEPVCNSTVGQSWPPFKKGLSTVVAGQCGWPMRGLSAPLVPFGSPARTPVMELGNAIVTGTRDFAGAVVVTARAGAVRCSNRKRGFCAHTCHSSLIGWRSFPGNGQVVDPAKPPTSRSEAHGSHKNPWGVGTHAEVGRGERNPPKSEHCVHQCACLTRSMPAPVVLQLLPSLATLFLAMKAKVLR